LSIRKLILGEGNRFRWVRSRKPVGLLLDSVNDNVGDKAIKLQDPRDKGFVLKIFKLTAEKERSPLHKAEADVLALTKELEGVAISDGHVARSIAGLIGIELHGTGYVLGRIYKAGRILKSELLRNVSEMRRSGWRITEEDYEKIPDYLRRL